MNKPLIGITLDWGDKVSHGTYPGYYLRGNFFDAVWAAGGRPIGLPPLTPDYGQEIVDLCDGFVFSGAEYVNSPAFYGEQGPVTDNPREAFEYHLAKTIIEKDKPYFGICGGMQIMGYMMGNTYYHDLHKETATTINHRLPHTDIIHPVAIKEGTLLHRLIGSTSLDVNSWHREAVKTLSSKLIVSATAPDGIIEALEVPGKKFALGVQWHPEFFIDEGSPHLALFKGLIDACRT